VRSKGGGSIKINTGQKLEGKKKGKGVRGEQSRSGCPQSGTITQQRRSTKSTEFVILRHPKRIEGFLMEKQFQREGFGARGLSRGQAGKSRLINPPVYNLLYPWGH